MKSVSNVSLEQDSQAESPAVLETHADEDISGEQASLDETIYATETHHESHGHDPAQSRVGTLIGKYRLNRVLGQGGMGTVYAARDQIIGRDVAVKFLSEDVAGDETALRRFIQEARAVGQLQHPNVVSLFDVDQFEGAWYLVMEMVEGGTAADLTHSGNPIPWHKATGIVAGACHGLAAAHKKGLIHRDIKPDNIMIAQDGTAKISDFGLAKMQDRRQATLTRHNEVLGTPNYMSPEQCRSHNVDERCDLYSMGATYYELLTGEPPYSESADVMQVMYAQCHEPPPNPCQAVNELPPACREIVERSMAKNPEERYQTADQMFADLETLLVATGTLSDTSRLSRISDTHRSLNTKLSSTFSLEPAKPRRLKAILGTVVALMTLVAGFFFFTRTTDPEQHDSTDLASPVVAAPTGPPIKIGLLHSLSGTMAISEKGLLDAELLAIEELNASGGVLGRPVEAVIENGQSRDEVFAEKAKRLITEENVVTLLGCWTSSSRKQVKTVVEEHDHLLIYPVQHEGLEQSPNIIYTGSVANQQIIPAVQWAYAFKGKRRFFLIGSDYIFPRAAGAIIKDALAEMDVEPVGEVYVPLGYADFDKIVRQIRESKADVILNMINGSSNLAFFHDLREGGIFSSEVSTISFSIAEPELRDMNIQELAGDYAAWSYFDSVETPENQDFVKRFHTRYNPTRVISDPMQTAYFSVKLWAQAIEQAGSVEPSVIRTAMVEQKLAAPEGAVWIDQSNGHTWKASRIGTITEEAQIEIIWSSPKPVVPVPFPKTRTRAQWENFLKSLQSRWNGNWSASVR